MDQQTSQLVSPSQFIPIESNLHYFVLDGGVFTYTFDFDLVPKKGKNYFDLKSPRIDFKFQRIYFQLDNLFNGDKRLGDQTNNFLNENWEDVAKDLSPIISETINVIVTSIFKGYTNRVPYDDFFLP